MKFLDFCKGDTVSYDKWVLKIVIRNQRKNQNQPKIFKGYCEMLYRKSNRGAKQCIA